MLSIFWPDGAITRGHSATDALWTIADKQWDQPMSIHDVKYVLAARAFGWNNSVIDPTLSDDDFVDALGSSGMVFVQRGSIKWTPSSVVD